MEHTNGQKRHVYFKFTRPEGRRGTVLFNLQLKYQGMSSLLWYFNFN